MFQKLKSDLFLINAVAIIDDEEVVMFKNSSSSITTTTQEIQKINDFNQKFNATITDHSFLFGEKPIYSIKIKKDDPFCHPHLPGDTIYIQCPNSNENLNFIMSKLGEENPLIREYIKWNVDLSYFPSKTFLKALAHEQVVKSDNAILIYTMATYKRASLPSQAYMSWAKEHATICDILYSLPDLTITLSTLLTLPKPPPRQYSLSYSCNNCFEILFSPIKVPFGRCGLASCYLENISIGDRIFLNDEFHLLHPTQPLRIRKPTLEKKALIICAGTGISPFMMAIREGFLKGGGGVCRFIYGLRRKNDFIFRDELESFNISVALSRDTLNMNDNENADNGLKFYYGKYVQDVLKMTLKSDLKDVQDGNLTIYLCGDQLSMIKDVMDLISTSLIDDFGFTSENVMDIIKKLDIVKEVWI